MAKNASPQWVRKLEALVDMAADTLREKMTDMQPEQLVSILAVASSEITSYLALVPQVDGEPGDDSPGEPGSTNRGQRKAGKGASRARIRSAKTRAKRLAAAAVDPAGKPGA